MRYIQAWVSDGAGNVSQATVLGGINYNPPGSTVLAGEVRLYRRTLGAGDVLSVTLQSTAGDADLYVWTPSGTLAAYSNGSGATDSVAVTAGEPGAYQVEVYGYADATYSLAMQVQPAGAAPAPWRPASSRPASCCAASPPSRRPIRPPHRWPCPPPPLAASSTCPPCKNPEPGGRMRRQTTVPRRRAQQHARYGKHEASRFAGDSPRLLCTSATLQQRNCLRGCGNVREPRWD